MGYHLVPQALNQLHSHRTRLGRQRSPGSLLAQEFWHASTQIQLDLAEYLFYCRSCLPERTHKTSPINSTVHWITLLISIRNWNSRIIYRMQWRWQSFWLMAPVTQNHGKPLLYNAWKQEERKRERERSRMTWYSTVEKHLSSIGLSWDIAAQLTEDQQAWRSCIALCAQHGMD